jgi:hypothetical protein
MEDLFLFDFIRCAPPYSKRYCIKKDGSIVYDCLKEKAVKTHKTPEGYVVINEMITDTGKVTRPRYHRLVAMNFIPVPERLKNISIDKLQINHLDENPSNNTISNLEWCTEKENKKHGNYIKNSTKNLTLHRYVYQYDKKTKELIRVYKNTNAAERYGFDSSGISRCCNGIYKQYKGYIFSYVKFGEEHKIPKQLELDLDFE